MSAISDFRDRMVGGALAFTGPGGIALAVGTNTFIGKVPEDPDNAVRLTQIPTPGPERVMGVGVAGIAHYNTNIQVYVRSKSHAVMIQMMTDIAARMDNFVGAIGANTYLWISQRSGVSEFGQDEGKRFQSVTMFLMEGPVP